MMARSYIQFSKYGIGGADVPLPEMQCGRHYSQSLVNLNMSMLGAKEIVYEKYQCTNFNYK